MARGRREELYKGAILHWHAVQKSNTSSKTGDNAEDESLPRDSKQSPACNRASARFDGVYNTTSREAVDSVVNRETNLYNMSVTSDTASSSTDDEGLVRRVSNPLDVDMSTEAKSITTISYQRALRNRPIERLLSDGEQFDPNAYTPTFLHDALMLPGSLANLLDKIPTWDIEKMMTPALLPGYTARIPSPSLQPALVQSDDPQAYVQGMLIFGLPKSLRRLIHAHYRPHAKRRKLSLEVELNVLVEESYNNHDWPLRRLRPRRRSIQSHVWLWSKKRGGEDFLDEGQWNLEDALEGDLGPKQTMLRVEGGAKGDEDADGWIGRDVVEVDVDPQGENERREREVVRGGGGSGSLDYERVTGVEFTGW